MGADSAFVRVLQSSRILGSRHSAARPAPRVDVHLVVHTDATHEHATVRVWLLDGRGRRLGGVGRIARAEVRAGVYLGFSFTYFGPRLRGTYPPTPAAVHVHGWSFFAWYLLLPYPGHGRHGRALRPGRLTKRTRCPP